MTAATTNAITVPWPPTPPASRGEDIRGVGATQLWECARKHRSGINESSADAHWQGDVGMQNFGFTHSPSAGRGRAAAWAAAERRAAAPTVTQASSHTGVDREQPRAVP